MLFDKTVWTIIIESNWSENIYVKCEYNVKQIILHRVLD